MRKIRLLSCVGGTKYLDYFKLCCLPSIYQSGNIPAVLQMGYQIEHLIIAKQDNREIRELLYSHVDRSSGNYRVAWDWYGNDGIPVLTAVLAAMKMCVQDGAYLMLAFPDWFFADGSIGNMVKFAANRDFCVAGLSVRVDDDRFMRELLVKNQLPIDAPHLVDMVFRNAHISFKRSDVSQEVNNSFSSHMATQPLSNSLWTITHRLPNIFLAHVIQEDVNDFDNTVHGLSHWDWVWPGKLIDQERFKYLGSSDLFFMAELTSPYSNLPKVRNDQWNDEVALGDPNVSQKHISHNKVFVGTLRGTK